jgi:zinc and cadmium transporter
MPTLGYILIATFSLSLIALIGVFSFVFRKKAGEHVLLFLISLSAGTLMGGAFLHLMPEGVEKLSPEKFFIMVLASFILFYFIEKILHWRHCHEGSCEVHSFGYMSLIGDSIHNFIDGLVIAATFLVDIKLGITTALAIGLHEIPQEIGDFAVLLYSGLKKRKALLFNFIIALTIVLGGLVGYFLALKIQNIVAYFLPLAAGGFLYISTSDLIPEIRKEKDIKKSLISFSIFLAGLAIMYLATLIE